MVPELAVVALRNWQWVVLIVLCFGSLIIALYCLLFMVPLKSFVERINSLGGGMKGIRAYIEGVKSETERQIADVQELLDHGREFVVLSRGMQLRLQTGKETLDFLEARNVACRIAETKEAVRIYNDLATHGERVGGLFHSTC